MKLKIDDEIKKNSITLFEIIKWLSIEERKKTGDIYEVYKNVSMVLEKIYNYKIPFYTVKYHFTTNDISNNQVQVLECENYLVEIIDFLNSLKFELSQHRIVKSYIKTLGLIDAKKQVPKDLNRNLFKEVKLEPNTPYKRADIKMEFNMN